MFDRKLFLLTILLVSILTISAASASDNITGDVVSTDDDINSDIISVSDDANLSILKANNANTKSFTELDEAINGNNDSDIYLDCDYTFNSNSDRKSVNINRAVTVHGNGHTIDGNNNNNGFIKAYNSNLVVLKDITFVNSKNYAISGCTAINCTFSSGRMYGGHAINCTFMNNDVNDGGGAIFYGDAINCTFINNSAEDGGAIYGGAATNCIFINNTANRGGAVFETFVVNCTFMNNDAYEYGGAVVRDFEDEFGSSQPEELVINCKFIDNSGDGVIYGGSSKDSIFINNSGRVIDYGSARNSIFINNSAGIHFGEGSFINCTFINNSAAGYGLIYGGSARNSIFINNSAHDGGVIFYGSATNCTFINNTALGNGGALYETPANNCTFINNCASGNGGAMFGNSAINCVFRDNHASNGGAGYGIKAVNSTFNNNIASENGGALCNSEFSLSCQFSNNSARIGNDIYNSTIIGKTFTDLNRLISENNGTELYLDDNYIFVAVVDGDIKDKININKPLTIYGNGFTLDANKGTRIFSVSNNEVVFHDIIFVNADGGAISGECTVINCTFINNYADSHGGAINGGSAINCTFINNSAADSGGAMCDGSAINCTFINNSVEHDMEIDDWTGEEIYFGEGGAIKSGSAINCIFINNDANYGGAMSVSSWHNAINCTFINNTGRYGAAVDWGSQINCTFINNTATYGGALYLGNASNCLFMQNYAYEMGGAMYYGTAINCIFRDNAAGISGNNTYETIIYPVLSVNNFISNYNSGEKLFVNLSSTSGQAIPNVNVTIRVYKNNNLVGTYYCLSGDGWTVDLDAGTYIAVCSVENQEYYVDEVNATLTVNKAIPMINVSTQSIVYGEDLVVNVSLMGNVVYRVNVTVGSQSKLLRLKDGKGTLRFSGLAVGSYDVVALYKGDANYNSVSAEVSVEVQKPIPKNFTVSASSIVCGEDLVVTVTSDDNLAYRVNVSVGDQSKLLRLKDGKGTLRFSGLAVGSYDVVALYKGDANYNSVSAEVSVEVQKPIPENFTVSANVISDEELVVNVSLDSDVAYRINVTVGDQSKLLRLKDGKGSLKFSGLGHGTYTVTALYKGDAIYSAASVSTVVVLKQIPKNFTVSADTVNYGEDLVVNVSLGDEVAYRINVTVGGQSKLLRLKDGKGSLRFSGLAAGNYTVTALYKGDAIYSAVSAEASAEVKKATPKNFTVSAITSNNEVVVKVGLADNVAYRINVTVGNQSKLLRLKDGAGSLKFSGLEAGTYDVVASYCGDSNYDKAFVNTTVIVDAAT